MRGWLRSIPEPWRRWAVDAILAALSLLDPILAYGASVTPGFGSAAFAAVAVLFRRRYPLAVFLATVPSLYFGNSFIQIASMTAVFTYAAKTGNRSVTTILVVVTPDFSVGTARL